MKIKFKKDLTRVGQDGFGLLFEVDKRDLEVQISKTFLAMFDISIENVSNLIEVFKLEGMINGIDNLFSKEDVNIIKIYLGSDGMEIRGKVYYSVEDLKKFIVLRK